jgi:hypothetical protein
MAWTFLNLITVTGFTADSTWRTLDLTPGFVPAGTKTVWLRARITASSATCAFASGGITTTSIPIKSVVSDKALYFFIGLDDDGLIKYYLSTTSNLYIEILGYTTESLTFPSGATTNYVDKSTATLGSYVNVSTSEITSSAAFAVALINNVAAGTGYAFNLRDNGSTDDAYYNIGAGTQAHCFLPITSNVGQQKIANAYVDLYLTGWLPATTWNKIAAPADITFASTGWQTVNLGAVVPSGALAVIFDIINTNAAAQIAAYRLTGSSDNITTGVRVYQGSRYHGLMGLNSSRQMDFNPGSTDVKIRILGYYLEVPEEITVAPLSFGLGLSSLDVASMATGKTSFNIEIELG